MSAESSWSAEGMGAAVAAVDERPSMMESRMEDSWAKDAVVAENSASSPERWARELW